MVVADVALAFIAAARAHERHQLISFECDFEIATGRGKGAVVPDAYLIYEAPKVELHAFVEVDLGTAGSRAFCSKIGRYLDLWRSGGWQGRYPIWPVVLVLAPDRSRCRLLRRATEAVLASQPDARAETEFAFASLEETSVDALGPIWEIAGRAGRHPLL